ncbi:MAG: RlmE family RNA methyltransferase [Treponema sp.]|jgi:23S rRNA (uridine2552-2'-O)-methyltransferase|nr:RlmE family RNA methyltransferase [Treponema sp.]
MSSYKKPDFWSLKAQKDGYPARSVYKLQEIDKKFAFFVSSCGGKSGRGGTCGLRALDLGAAPGSWSLYILRRYGGSRGPENRAGLPAEGAENPAETAIDPAADPARGPEGFLKGPLKGGFFLAAADLLPLPRRHDRGLFDRGDFFFVQGDFTADPVREELVRRGPYTAVVSDAAPATTGNRSVDTPRSLALVEEALGCAEQCLVPGGNLAVKVFQGDTAALLARLRESFTTVKSFKPAACRSGSFETYYIGLGKRGYTHS